ncbi:uncharacterized protein LOC134255822 [Saccostrea cucullata]|uniref:uncharacterized protein LOC134255822 n=1 Tax=Saccostrea cuccullata TaxID=36930 RepID=UPI002ED5E33A
MDCRLLLIVSLIVPVSSAITESHQQLRANSVGTITRTGAGCSTLQHASLLQIQENTDPGIPLFNITGVSDLYFMENHDGFELEKTENQSIWLIKANRSFDFESLPKQQNIGFKVQCEDSVSILTCFGESFIILWTST